MSQQQIRVGIIGAGSISDLHIAGHQRSSRSNVMAICDQNAERAKAKARQYGIPHYCTNYKELLSLKDIDAIVICTYNATHAQIAIDALASQKHVFVEKPLCISYEEAQEIEAAVKKSGKQLQVGFVRRFDSKVEKIKEMVDSGAIGEIYYAKMSALRRLGNPGGWFADKEKSGGGPLIDVGIHLLDLCLYFMASPTVKTVKAVTYKKLGSRNHIKNLSYYTAADPGEGNNTVEELAAASIRFDNGACLLLDTSYTLHASKDETVCIIYGTKGGVEVEPNFVVSTDCYNTILNAYPQIDQDVSHLQSAYPKQIEGFIDCCMNGSAPRHSIEDSLLTMKIIHAIYESAENGNEIFFE
ncbi:Gfo/Idh/MocA family protein [Bacillus testis]|uniref:Gfo/Idh/MocA family protein n=1 Tax=Bacillus testis TaxID=1622072 RepID=UPI00067EC0E6|nr:Gfo/Idh/MocA family oxidoreductase [Bacillus testis]